MGPRILIILLIHNNIFLQVVALSALDRHRSALRAASSCAHFIPRHFAKSKGYEI
jgi:hypothetical protein